MWNQLLSSRLLNNSITNLFRWRVQSETLVGKTHLLCEGRVGFPSSRVAGIRLFHHLVDLFEGETFGFGLRNEVLASAAS